MGLLWYLSRGFAFCFEVIYYLVGAAMTYMSVKALESHLRWHRSPANDPASRRSKSQYRLVIDLDDILIRAIHVEKEDSDVSVPITIGGKVAYYMVLKRPHLEKFLVEMRRHYEIVLYTTSQKEYADVILKHIGIYGLFSRRLYSDSCIISSEGVYIKDLHTVSNDLSKIVLVENSIQDGIVFPDNFVPIDSWFGGLADTALLDIMPFLEALTHVDDVRDILGLRCNDPRTYSAINSTRGRGSNENSEHSRSPPSHRDVTELANEDANWDAIGQRLTSKAKQIFDTIDTHDGFHVQRPSARRSDSNTSK